MAALFFVCCCWIIKLIKSFVLFAMWRKSNVDDCDTASEVIWIRQFPSWGLKVHWEEFLHKHSFFPIASLQRIIIKDAFAQFSLIADEERSRRRRQKQREIKGRACNALINERKIKNALQSCTRKLHKRDSRFNYEDASKCASWNCEHIYRG